MVALSCAGLCAPGCTGDNAPADEGQTLGGADVRWRPEPDRARCDAADAAAPAGAVGRSVLSERRLQRLAAGAVDVRRLQRIEHGAGRHGVHVAVPHPAFRSVSAACAPGIAGAAVKLADRRGHRLLARSAGLRVRSGADRGRLDQPRSRSPARRASCASASTAPARSCWGSTRSKLVFALKLTNGKTVGVSAGGLAAGRFTHVAATYDGKDAILYVDGAAVAKTHAVGKIAPGAGPIFIGNDANGRVLKGVVDSVWLNTLAAPANVIKELTCIRQPPVVTLSPAMSAPQVAGTTVPYDLSITNANGAELRRLDVPVLRVGVLAAVDGRPLRIGHGRVGRDRPRDGEREELAPVVPRQLSVPGAGVRAGGDVDAARVRERDLRRRDGSRSPATASPRPRRRSPARRSGPPTRSVSSPSRRRGSPPRPSRR